MPDDIPPVTTLCSICGGVFGAGHLTDAHPNQFLSMDFDPDTQILTILGSMMAPWPEQINEDG